MSLPSTDALLQTLAVNVRLLRGMTRPQLMQLLGVAEKCAVHGGHCFFEEGEPGASFHVIISGTVLVSTQRMGRRIDLAQLGAGEVFGEMCLTGLDARTATVRAMEDTLTLRFARERVDAQRDLAAVIYRNIASVLVRRLVTSNDKVGELLLSQPVDTAPPHIYGIRPPGASDRP